MPPEPTCFLVNRSLVGLLAGLLTGLLVGWLVGWLAVQEVGASERSLQQLFARARQSAPAVLVLCRATPAIDTDAAQVLEQLEQIASGLL